MSRISLFLFYPLFFTIFLSLAVGNPDSSMPVRGLAIAAPTPDGVGRFMEFMEAELAPRRINTLVLRVDYNYEYTSHPELRSGNPLTREQVRQLADMASELGIEIIPQVNLLGHQSWHSRLGKLLEVYPEFDETPGIELPEEYAWPNEDGLYCKSYCTLHPGVHPVVFAIVDELMDAFGARAFHAGMDEVFYIAHPDCPRCANEDPARLFANEVTRIRDHLAGKGRVLWIWGDRLIDGKATGLGEWEASINNTHPAIDWIPRDVVICDWHYERAEPTAPFFALKGFSVVTCPWDEPDVALKQLEQTRLYRSSANPELAGRFLGMMHTVWSPAHRFIEKIATGAEGGETGDAECFRALFKAINED